MKPSTLFSLLLPALLLTACNGQTNAEEIIPAVTPSQVESLPENMRDYRYCEIIPVFQQGLNLNVVVYNTLGSNQCPQDLWDQLDAKALAKEYGAKIVKLNGPRYWVLNKISGQGISANGKTVDFNGIEMTERATLQTNLLQGSIGDKTYTPNQVKRDTVFEYWAGNEVYELISPEGNTYIMQSYSQIADSSLTIDDLASLGERLNLPEGWRYQAITLEKDLFLKANGVAYVINDEFYNTYQQILP